MREILFRAKRIDNGEWVNGYYVYDYAHNAHFIFKNQLVCPNCINDRRVDYSVCDYEINPETLCQYTGLKDKNGEKIFIGDIIRCTKGCPHEVIWLKEYAGRYFGGMPAVYLSGLLEGYTWTGEEEKIGNIFDNPELLKAIW